METRIQNFLVKESLAPTKFAEIIGVQRSSISHILSGRNKPSFDLIQKIMVKFPRLNPDWLILGTGNMYRNVKQTSIFDTEQSDAKKSFPSTAVPSQTAQPDKQNTSLPKPTENSIKGKAIERVVVFYNDKTFREYLPE